MCSEISLHPWYKVPIFLDQFGPVLSVSPCCVMIGDALARPASDRVWAPPRATDPEANIHLADTRDDPSLPPGTGHYHTQKDKILV